MRKHLFVIALVSITLLAWIMAWSQLPADVIMHRNERGTADDVYIAKIGAMILDVGLMIVVAGILTVVPKIDPEKEKNVAFMKSYKIMKYVFLLCFFLVTMMTLFGRLGYVLPVGILLLGIASMIVIAAIYAYRIYKKESIEI
ncbi:hypothetical protein BAMA_11860 [Bacillus manliponensis]|uniref:DUF1648 domain-containing protein n=1 Tax=Bacillus manliponensis TaxID=574376 RepID=A0A073JTU2_9BACI|nr:hypothetical protein [Bacillus manliponensis]KEK17657.1 hypothetical protein BAMA_11860 [Bacillus manliponensis]